LAIAFEFRNNVQLSTGCQHLYLQNQIRRVKAEDKKQQKWRNREGSQPINSMSLLKKHRALNIQYLMNNLQGKGSSFFGLANDSWKVGTSFVFNVFNVLRCQILYCCY